MTAQLSIQPDAAVDLHMHTTYSDGRWPAQQLINYLVAENFDLVAVTDHDRVDRVAEIQALGSDKGLPILPGVELSTEWQGKLAHMLCYGFDPANNQLVALTEKVVRLQRENTYEVNETLRRRGYEFPRQEELLAEKGGTLQLPADNIMLLREHGYAASWQDGLSVISEAGFRSILADMAEAVEAVHSSGAVCLIAHPGRRERGFTFYDPALLDQLRAEVSIDGIEVYHPYHSQDVIEAYLEYVREHNLLMSTGSDSHCTSSRMPIKYRAETSRRLLERLGVTVA